jgi:transcriptional regulator with XRE-family HTH domain
LRRAREAANLSASKASEVSGVGMSYIYQIEKWGKNPSFEIVVKLAKAYQDISIITEYAKENDISEDTLMEVRNDYFHQKIEFVINKNPEALVEFMELINKYERAKDEK